LNKLIYSTFEDGWLVNYYEKDEKTLYDVQGNEIILSLLINNYIKNKMTNEKDKLKALHVEVDTKTGDIKNVETDEVEYPKPETKDVLYVDEKGPLGFTYEIKDDINMIYLKKGTEMKNKQCDNRTLTEVLSEDICLLKKENKELKKQIEKMGNCGNCKHCFREHYQGSDPWLECEITGETVKTADKCEYWKLIKDSWMQGDIT